MGRGAPDPHGTRPPELHGLAIRELRVSLAGRPVLDGASVDVPRGAVTAVLGPSGAGKSTLLRAVVRLVPIDGGTIDLDGEDVTALDPRALRRRVGLVAQAPVMLEGSVADNLRYANETASDDQVAAALEAAELSTSFAGRVARDLSGGERSRVALARALAREPEALLLDEPTAALDGERAEGIGRTLRRLCRDGRAVCVTTHDEAFAGTWADRVERLA